ncbi:pyruvate flavodoxin/ferredoxin oxidoreductase-like protein [Streptomyces sp. TLI_185]|nr:pyruvate flavodoxin/ferredoxin oxidoreductase-like protein [Streptomyces sp. TLI_185]
MLKQTEGSRAVAETIACCRPEVIAAYPISPQTHIVEELSRLVKSGALKPCEYVNVESEFAAMSMCIGASAAGARTYTATASQARPRVGRPAQHLVLLRRPGLRTADARTRPPRLDVRRGGAGARRVHGTVRGPALHVLRSLLRVRQLLRRLPGQRDHQAGAGQGFQHRPRLLQGVRAVRGRVPVRGDRHGAGGVSRTHLIAHSPEGIVGLVLGSEDQAEVTFILPARRRT